jgi:hypothetical protein
MKIRAILGVIVFTAIAAGQSQAQLAQNQAQQTVTFAVNGMSRISFTGSPSLTITEAVAGDAPTSVTANGSWAVTTNQTSQKVTASLNSAMPSGLTLSANLGNPTGAASSGAVALGITAVDVVTGITKLNESGLNVTYTLAATSAAGVVTSQNRVVTYTITAGI